jgi:hypothetical protein
MSVAKHFAVRRRLNCDFAGKGKKTGSNRSHLDNRVCESKMMMGVASGCGAMLRLVLREM